MTPLRILHVLLTAIVIQFAIATYVQGEIIRPRPDRNPAIVPDPWPDSRPKPNPYHNPKPNDINGIPGAPASGTDPEPVPEKEEPDWDDVIDELEELLESIVDAAKPSSSSSSSTTTTTNIAHVLSSPIPRSAFPCNHVLRAFTTCSADYSGRFSTVTATVQAGCLCNVRDGFDFNAQMRGCYSYAHAYPQYQSHASAIAGATAACRCKPVTEGGTVHGCPTETTQRQATASRSSATYSSSSSSSRGTVLAASITPPPTGTFTGTGTVTGTSTSTGSGSRGAVRRGRRNPVAVAAVLVLGVVTMLL